MTLAGRVAVVTGGSSGIGFAIAGVLARGGAQVVLAARDRNRLEQARTRLTVERAVLTVETDTADQAKVDALVADVIDRCGRIDLLVNCAANANGVAGLIENLDSAALLRDLDVKVVGYARAIKAVTPTMKRQRGGRIICIGGFTGKTSDTLSGMRNAAVSHLCKTVSDQLGPFGITVNAVHPGIVRSSHLDELFERHAGERGVSASTVEAEFVAETPLRRTLSPEEIGDAVAFLASDAAAGITGQSITIDGGLVRGIYL